MKVAITFPGCHRRGGVERVVFECARFLSGRGHEVHVFANQWEDDGTGRTHYHHVPMRHRPGFRRGRSFLQNATRLLDPAAFDVVNTHGCVSPFDGVQWAHSIHAAWLEAARRLRRPWSIDHLKQRLNPAHPALLELERQHFRGRRYQHVIALTEHARRDLMRLYDVPAEDIDTIAPGYCPEQFNLDQHDAQRRAMRRRLGYTERDRVVVFVANELERKGFGPLLQALHTLADPTVKLLVVGRVRPGGYTRLIDRLGLRERVHFAGVVSNDELAASYAAADVFALPTQYEGWGLVVIEAMACGLPALTTRRAPASIAIEPGRTGELVDEPDDVPALAAGLRRLIEGGHDDRRRISDSVQAYRWDRVLLAYEQLLERACARAPTKPTSPAPDEALQAPQG